MHLNVYNSLLKQNLAKKAKSFLRYLYGIIKALDLGIKSLYGFGAQFNKKCLKSR